MSDQSCGHISRNDVSYGVVLESDHSITGQIELTFLSLSVVDPKLDLLLIEIHSSVQF